MAPLIPQRWSSAQKLWSLLALALLSYALLFHAAWGDRSEEEAQSSSTSHGMDAHFRDIENGTLGFQKLLVINMPARTDRRDATSLAAAVSGLEIEWVKGVGGESVPEAALPPGNSRVALKLSKGIRGSWRSHMNALQRIVYENLTTALIFEDDVDWDIRLRSQLRTFAEASQFLSSRPRTDLARYPVASIPNPETEESIHNESSIYPISHTLFSLPLPSIHHHGHSRASPYGDPHDWDLLWLGHCGAGFPRFPADNGAPDKANIVLSNPHDATVPLPQYLRAHPFGPLDALTTSHPNHTRVYHRASGGALCTVAYAVSQRGARRLLHEFGVKSWGRIFDVELGDWCAGSDDMRMGNGEEAGKTGERGERICLTSQPPVFAHHHPDGGESDIGGLGGGYAKAVETKYVRKSVRMNLEALVRGDQEVKDQWPG